jgi:hypothetical protein
LRDPFPDARKFASVCGNSLNIFSTDTGTIPLEPLVVANEFAGSTLGAGINEFAGDGEALPRDPVGMAGSVFIFKYVVAGYCSCFIDSQWVAQVQVARRVTE